MSLEIDLRDPQEYVRFRLSADELPLGAERQTGSLPARALELAALTTSVLGVRDAAPITFLAGQPTGDEQGSRSVFLRQHVGGVRVFEAEQVVGFASTGLADFTRARLYSGAGEPEYRLVVSSEDAVRAAVAHVEAGAFEPVVSATFPEMAELPTVFEAGPFEEPIRAALLWVPIGKRLRLAWSVHLTLPAAAGAFQVIVAADTGDILYATQLMLFATTGSVFPTDPGTPRKTVSFAPRWSDYDLEPTPKLPAAPPAWVTSDLTEGPTCRAYLADTRQPVRGTLAGDDVTFDPPDQAGIDQQVVNAFYGACFMHDLMYLIGFREGDGSFQSGAVTGGLPARGVRVAVHTQPVLNLANWFNGIISLGPRKGTDRHTSVDMSVVCHEYAHAVTSRIVGGPTPNPFTVPQSRGLSEGWSDYFSCTALNIRVIGEWTRNPDGAGPRFYDDRFPADRADFGLLPELAVYEIAQLWCRFLLDVTDRIGRQPGMQLALDGVKGLLSNPDLLDARDNLLFKADRQLAAGLTSGAVRAVWAAAAARGMGIGAHYLPDGRTVPDDQVPPA
ncbi:M36 family metallopeptidase [Actinoplanes solisilvae]|uniref:M36 family metallopeptidase n=1 Tax=Actinoplanes solisilvae TaxID=2486853 RepID=UPI000FD9DC37|nr:M36 family metallopeptidase [Actinoplanes solisilvae]